MQKIRIGTRESKLAIWQAEYVQSELEKLGIETELVFIKSDGEKDLISPLYEMGVQGIFTKTLDIALLDGRIDIAVHSLKDVPTKLPEGILLASVPKRGNHGDVLIHKGALPEDTFAEIGSSQKQEVRGKEDFSKGVYSDVNEQEESNSDDEICSFSELPEYIIGTSSLRRRAQWLNRYPTHATEPLRGNIQARLEKLEKNTHWSGAIFAGAAVERLGLDIEKKISLDWMLPAPAQGVLGITCLELNKEVIELCRAFNDRDTELATYIERQFLRTLFGGCSMPIAAYARFDGDYCEFRGNILSIDGREKVEVELRVPRSEADTLGERAAEEVIRNGGDTILKTFNKM